ncbi:MAG TPA: 5'/3'-nucleotidase SurE [Ignavibacteria bacterium]|nr:5'/3'-nucleotidase SurE [Bacteroidota bacterium]HRE11234.1 5'/3'-nucleotidase SurE [Ignavibacteria bacterium]HRF64717.1 5'/3'-nucleotidase SurE [Ignavibacteria bacterium]HRJ03582.1 5'/3'-nucleotidase SurE [Ignavibacteria bacterium]HRJ84167.1 5'/3'-nucleotidase SurE [Ignavibacteria bacterium]
MNSKPNILVSNDDGIEAPGLQRLVEELKTFANVYVSAPYTQQSAVGHSITIFTPLRTYEHKKNGSLYGIAVEGTPADAVKIGVLHFFRDVKFDLVVSGINHGANTAINIIYSGTVSAATEGTILGIPSIAVSLTTFDNVDFIEPAKMAADIIKQMWEDDKINLHEGTLLNMNIPNLPAAEIKGVKITKQGRSYWKDGFEVRKDPHGKEYYWLTGNMVYRDDSTEYDVAAVQNKYISVTPLHFDLTDYRTYEEIKNWKLNI